VLLSRKRKQTQNVEFLLTSEGEQMFIDDNEFNKIA
jgi:hypothetical protein